MEGALSSNTVMPLAWGFSFEDLHTPEGLERLDAVFLGFLKARDPDLEKHVVQRRLSKTLDSELLVKTAPVLEVFLRQLVGLSFEDKGRQDQEEAYALMARVKKEWVQRRVGASDPSALSQELIQASIHQVERWIGQAYDPLVFCQHVDWWLQDPSKHASALEWALCYTFWALNTQEGQSMHAQDPLFHLPHKHGGYLSVTPKALVGRDGFNHTDQPVAQAYAMDQAHYCLVCHERHKDSCSQGLKDRSGDIRTNTLGVALEGCPLGQKISEMVLLKRQGWTMGALAVIMIHNPLVAGTGHRICWDCARSCIFQSQDPVDIPALETQILEEVLALDWGFEIYALLTRWNPLKVEHWTPQAPSGHTVLVVGLGPAGMMLSHDLLNAGHQVVAVDGLPLEHLPQEWITHPLRRTSTVRPPLEQRRAQGMGGVMEYGITARWDKTLLTLLRLVLERRPHFSCHGSIRVGGTVTLQDCFDQGYDHIALCLGAGRPHFPTLPGASLRGVHVASDVLMTLHMQESFRWDTVASLALDLPLVVIGGGLTAVDVATEAQALYIRQVERCLERYEALPHPEAYHATLSEPEKKRVDRWLEHGRTLRNERQQAAEQGRPVSFSAHLQQWGGVHILYRQGLESSPAYRTNPHEIRHALAQGIHMATHTVVEQILDQEGNGSVTHVQIQHRGVTSVVPCRTVMMATGMIPNVSLASEEPWLKVKEGYFQTHAEQPQGRDIFCVHTHSDGRSISFLGDLHPDFHGSVVKAMASARRFAPLLDHALRQRKPCGVTSPLPHDPARIQSCEVMEEGWVQLVVHAPLWAQKYRPASLYRVQVTISGLKSEPIPLAPVAVDPEKGLLTFWVAPRGASTLLLTQAKPGQPLALMGPSGDHTVPLFVTDQRLLMIGQGLGVLRLMALGHFYRSLGVHVTLWAVGVKPSMVRHPFFQRMADRIVLDPKMTFQGQDNEDSSPFDGVLMSTSPALQKQILELFKDHASACHGFIQAPLQCMMKGVCGRCIQTYQTPDDPQHSLVFFACEKTLHPLQTVDEAWNTSRLDQNHPMERLNHLWVQAQTQRS